MQEFEEGSQDARGRARPEISWLDVSPAAIAETIGAWSVAARQKSSQMIPAFNRSHLSQWTHDNQSVSGVSLAVSPGRISECHLQPGQMVTVTLANGQVLTGRYDDTTANWLTGGVDIYDPNNTVTFGGEAVIAIDGAPAAAGYNTGVGQVADHVFTTAAMGLDALPAFLLGFFVLVSV